MRVVRGKVGVVVVCEDSGLGGVVLEEEDGGDVDRVVVVGRGELTARAKTAIAAQKLLRLSLSSAADWPLTVTMLVAALVLRASIWILLEDSMETMLSWQLAVSRQTWS